MFAYLSRTCRQYPEVIPVLGVTGLACCLGTYMLVRNYNWNRVQWVTADPALARSPNENTKLWNNNKNTGGKYIHETLPKP